MAMQRMPETVGYVQEIQEPERFKFPGEFGGITHVVSFRYEYQLAGALKYLEYEAMVNTHKHNIAVAFDGNRIYATKHGVECIRQYVEVGLMARLEDVDD